MMFNTRTIAHSILGMAIIFLAGCAPKKPVQPIQPQPLPTKINSATSAQLADLQHQESVFFSAARLKIVPDSPSFIPSRFYPISLRIVNNTPVTLRYTASSIWPAVMPRKTALEWLTLRTSLIEEIKEKEPLTDPFVDKVRLLFMTSSIMVGSIAGIALLAAATALNPITGALITAFGVIGCIMVKPFSEWLSTMNQETPQFDKNDFLKKAEALMFNEQELIEPGHVLDGLIVVGEQIYRNDQTLSICLANDECPHQLIHTNLRFEQ